MAVSLAKIAAVAASRSDSKDVICALAASRSVCAAANAACAVVRSV